jgi:hypothetical protein
MSPSTGPGTAPPPPVGTRGSAPDPITQMWITAAKELAPDKSLQRVQDSAKWLFTSIGAVTALITGFGLISGDRLRANPVALVVAIVLAALSLFLAMVSLVVNPRNVRIESIDSVRSYYEHDLRWKGRLVQAGGICFAAALIAGALAASLGAAPGPTVSPITSAHWSGTGASSKLSVTTAVSGAPAGAVITLIVTAPGGGGTTILADETRADATGKGSLADDLAAQGLTSARISIRVLSGGVEVQSDVIDVSRSG